MRLTPRELDSLLVAQAGFLAQKRLARGRRLNHPEAVALIAAQVQELARDGCSVAELMSKGRTLLGRRQLQEGVPDLIPEVQVEATFPDGTKLVTVSRPICREHGDLELALYGSFLPVPDHALFQDASPLLQDKSAVERSPPGSVYPSPDSGPIALNVGRRRVALSVASVCDRPIQVGSHYHFIEANKNLLFDRALAYGKRLDIPAGTSVRFEPGDVKEVTLVEIAGRKVVSGGNGLCSGAIQEANLAAVMDRVRRRGFGNRKQSERPEPVPCLMPRYLYAKNYGPTLGDKVRLGDTCLVIEVEKDFCVYGDECKFGGGKVLREGMGQANLLTRAEALDTVITNCLIVDAVLGVVKADLGIKGSRICGIGKAGNPDVMAGVSEGMAVAACTEVVAAEGLIVTAGALDCHVHFICPQLAESALAAGVTSLLGGGTGPAAGTCATTCTPGPHHIRSMMESTDAFPLNFGFTGKGNSSDVGELSAALEEQVVAGAIGLKLHEDWGSTPAAIDACLKVAEAHDVQVTIHTDTLNESSCVEDTVAAFAGRTVHAYHAEGAGGGHAPDIIRVCGERNVLPSSTTPTRPFTANTVDEHLDMLLRCHHLDRNLKEDLAFAESRIRGETIAAEDVLHDMGAIGIISSDSQAMGRIGEVVSRTWQTADKMKRARGPLPEDPPTHDNARVRRYLAKYTANPALAHGVAHLVGSVEVGKMADLVLWHPAFFGAKPKMVIKGGQIVWSEMGLANASIPTAEPVLHRKMFGACGRSPAKNSCLFVSKASLEQGVAQTYDVHKELVVVKGCRSISKKDLLWNDALPKLRVDPETYKVYAAENKNGEEVWTHLTCEPATRVALASKYFLF